MAPRKRAPGGGRKPLDPIAKTANFSTRCTPEMRARLEALAAEKGKSISQISEKILELGLQQYANDQLSSPIRALAYLLRLLALRCSYVDTSVSDDDREWHNDPFAFDAFARAIQMLLERIRPAGEIKTPKEVFPGLPTWPTSERQAEVAFADVWRQVMTLEPISKTKVIDRDKQPSKAKELAAQRGWKLGPISDEWAGRISGRSYSMDDIRRTFGIKSEVKKS
ncbi:MAG: hypothetical protein Q8M18_10995 [Bradyrhizobium sp.]|nr:hypothetical protein [Bradyrhizobium sp.]